VPVAARPSRSRRPHHARPSTTVPDRVTFHDVALRGIARRRSMKEVICANSAPGTLRPPRGPHGQRPAETRAWRKRGTPLQTSSVQQLQSLARYVGCLYRACVRKSRIALIKARVMFDPPTPKQTLRIKPIRSSSPTSAQDQMVTSTIDQNGWLLTDGPIDSIVNERGMKGRGQERKVIPLGPRLTHKVTRRDEPG
jgi:hypothetical protein